MDGGSGLCLQKLQTLYNGYASYAKISFYADCTSTFHRFIQYARIFPERFAVKAGIGGVKDAFPPISWYKSHRKIDYLLDIVSASTIIKVGIKLHN